MSKRITNFFGLLQKKTQKPSNPESYILLKVAIYLLYRINVVNNTSGYL